VVSSYVTVQEGRLCQIAVGPLGRNAEGSGAVNSKGKVAAMYSYSKTKGLFGGVSVEGTVIIERQDANRIAYGGSISVKEILSGQIDRPGWSDALVEQIENSTGLPYGQKWRDADQDGEGGAMGYTSSDLDDGYGSPPGTGNGKEKENGSRSRGSSVGQGYVFGEGIGSGRNSPNILAEKLETGRRRAGSLLGPNADKERPANKRASSSFNPFSSGPTTPKRNPVLASSESYNAGLTWDSDGPMQQQTRPRSSTNPNRARAGTGSSSRGGGDEELWNNTTGSFAKMAIANESRSRSGSNPPPFDDVPERYDDDGDDFGAGSSSRKADPFNEPAYQSPSRSLSRGISASNLNDPYRSSSPLRNSQAHPKLAVKEGLDEQDGYARAMGLFDFKATTPGDLGFSKGQILVVLGKEGGDWWRGRDTRGKEGIFPSNYVEVVELPKVPRGNIARSELKKRTPDLDFD